LKKLCVKIPLLQAIQDIPIYVKTVRELCLKKVGRKKKDPPTIQFIGQSADQLTNQIRVDKYEDLGNPIVTVCIKGTYIPNTLIDLGAAINVMTLQTMRELSILNIRPTPTMLELADRSKIKPEGVLDDQIVSIESWEYPIDFFILQPKSASGGHPIDLGRPWLATVNAFIGCRSGTMYISRGESVKQIKLYPPSQPKTETQNILWYDNEASDVETTQPIFTIDQIKSL
jgi:hypothetical protein